MFRLWGKLWKDNHMMKDLVIDDDSEDTRTHKIFRALQEICYDFDLENPIWLDSNVTDFKRHSRTRFRQDSFIEHIEFVNMYKSEKSFEKLLTNTFKSCIM